jgi:PAS domain S-box-containing protein
MYYMLAIQKASLMSAHFEELAVFTVMSILVMLFAWIYARATNLAHEYAALFEDNLAAVCVSTTRGQLLDCNSAFLRMYGFKSKAEARECPTAELFPTAADLASFMQDLEASGTLVDYACLQRRRDGTPFWTLEHSKVLVRQNRRVIQRTLVDITKRRQEKIALRESENRFATIFRESPIGCAIVSLDGIYLDVNQSLMRMLKRPAEEIIGKTGVDFGFWRSHQQREEFIHRLRLEGSIQDLSVEFKDSEGGRHWGLYWATIIRIGDQDRILAMQLDQTEQREFEARYMQSQKMEPLGMLAGGIAHDFNNMLGIIGGFAELLAGRSDHDEVSKRYCTKIAHAANRATGLTRQLLNFSRKEVIRPCPLQPARAIREIESILPCFIGEDIELSLDLKAKGAVLIDPVQFEQIIYNLVANARDAMPAGGHLSIELEDVFDSPASSAQRNGAGCYVAIRISDTGIGMDEATRQHAFDPFFTTKGAERGTGLGLATVRTIVQQCSGEISLQSHPGKGTRISILLPATSYDEPSAVSGTAQRLDHERGNILLVEDQLELCEASAEFLRSVGYTVICASSGADALEQVQDTGHIDLVISDVVMPKMNGRELMERILLISPDTQVLFISGYGDDVILRAGISSKAPHFLQKPYSLKELGRKVQQILAVKAGSNA